MKKFLAVFASLAVAATMCASLAACGGKNGDESVLTEEQWVKAFEDTAAAKAFTITSEMSAKGTADGEQAESYSKTVAKYDAENYMASAEIEGYEKIGDEKEETVIKAYALVEGKTLSAYTYRPKFDYETFEYGDPEWQGADQELASEDAAKLAFATTVGSMMSMYGDLDFGHNRVTVDGERGYIIDLFDAFTWDKGSKSYTLETDDGTLTIAFRDGLVYRYYGESTMESGDDSATMKSETIVTYGSVSVSIPKEAKDAVKDED